MRAIGGRDVAVVATAAVLAALLLANGADGAELVGAMAVVTAILIVWFAVGRGSVEGSRRAIATVVLVVVLSGVGTAISPSMATVQAIAFPLVWTLTRSTRGAVIANVALALSVGTGYFLVIGPSLVAFAQTLVIEIISLAGSFAIGFWISRISVESAERATLLAELRETQEQLASVSRDAGAAGERERLARDIHDTIAQDLTGLVLLAQRTRRELQGGSATVGETLDLLEESARSALAETRSLVATSAPLGLADDGIVGALTRLAERFSRETGIAVLVSGEVPELPRETEVVLLRCAQEGLANVRKHSGAVTATLTLFSRDGSVGVSLSDDGDGFDPRTVREGFGLSGMRARLDLVGGRLEIAGQPGEGTTITASLPLTVGAEK
jgi:signal transduction histidine kinase